MHVYKRVDLEWRLEDILNQHDLRVTGIDWAPKTNRLVTCAVDRNAYVWTQGDDGRWRPTLVLLRINRFGNLQVLHSVILFFICCPILKLELIMISGQLLVCVGHHWKTSLQLEVAPVSFRSATLSLKMTGGCQSTSRSPSALP